MRGLTVRWSLTAAPAGVAAELADYVAEVSYQKFTELPGLCFKTWRLVPGEWFEGCYVFEDAATRAKFQAEFTEIAATAPGSKLIGSAPILIEACEILAIAAGPSGFTASPRVS